MKTILITLFFIVNYPIGIVVDRMASCEATQYDDSHIIYAVISAFPDVEWQYAGRNPHNMLEMYGARKGQEVRLLFRETAQTPIGVRFAGSILFEEETLRLQVVWSKPTQDVRIIGYRP